MIGSFSLEPVIGSFSSEPDGPATNEADTTQTKNIPLLWREAETGREWQLRLSTNPGVLQHPHALADGQPVARPVFGHAVGRCAALCPECCRPDATSEKFAQCTVQGRFVGGEAWRRSSMPASVAGNRF